MSLYMKFSNNPHSVYNGAISGQRNMFLSSSLATIMIGFSHNFKNKDTVIFVKLIGLCIFALSIVIGFLTNYDFRFYLDKMKNEMPEYVPIDNWYTYSFIVYIYTFLIAIIIVLFLLRDILHIHTYK